MATVDDEQFEPRAYGRRGFLAVTAVGLSSLLWGEPAWRALSGLRQPIVNALPPALFPNGWRIYTVASSMPRFDPASWRLEIGGLVDRPLTLDYGELRALPGAEQVAEAHARPVHVLDRPARDAVEGADL